MRPFAGFPKAGEIIGLSPAFFDQLLPQMDDLPELKVLLHILALLQRQKGWPRCVSRGQLRQDESLQRSLTSIGDPRPFDAILEHGLERASQRGALLRLTVRGGDQAEDWYLLNTEKGRKLLRDLQGSDEEAVELRKRFAPSETAAVDVSRPNIFALYEDNIGLLTRLLAEKLIEAEATYPETWIEEAFRLAVERNKRNWRYIEAILGRWAAEGREDGTFKRHPGEIYDPDRYIKGEFGHLFRH